MGNQAKPDNNNSSTPTQSSQENGFKAKVVRSGTSRRARRNKQLQLQNNLLIAQQMQFNVNNPNQKKQKVTTITPKTVNSMNELFQKLASRNLKASSNKVSGSKNSSVIPIGATCSLCGITFYEEKMFDVHKDSETHQKLYEMSQARETAVRQLLRAHTALMVERENVKLDDDLAEKKDPCHVCLASSKDTIPNHKKTQHHQLVNAYINRKCDYCKKRVNGLETAHQRKAFHLWGEIEAEMKHESKNFDSAFNQEENLPLSLRNDLKIRELVSEVKYTLETPNLISLTDYDPSMPLGLNFILPRYVNYCLVCKREVQKAHTDHQKGAILSSEMHCRSYVHYTKLARALQDHKDEMLEYEEGTVSGDKKGKLSAAAVINTPLPETEALTDTEIEEEVLTMEGIEATEAVTDTETEEEVLTAVMEGIESTVVPVTFEDEEETDTMDGIESPVAVDFEIEEETETASVEELESAAAVASKSSNDVKVDGHDESSAEVPAKESNVGSTQQKEVEELSTQQKEVEELSTQQKEVEELSTKQKEVEELSTQQKEVEQLSTQQKEVEQLSTQQKEVEQLSTQQKEVEGLSTQQKEVEELSKNVALIGDSWMQDFPLQTLPDEWNVSKFGWKLASAKAFLVREDIQSVIDTNPSVAVLHLGANDICKKYSCESICCDILDIVKSLEEENITTLVCEVPPKTAPQKISESDYNTVRQEVNTSIVQKLPKSTSVIHISDLQDHLINGVDLSADGYTKFSDVIKTMIESRLSANNT